MYTYALSTIDFSWSLDVREAINRIHWWKNWRVFAYSSPWMYQHSNMVAQRRRMYMRALCSRTKEAHFLVKLLLLFDLLDLETLLLIFCFNWSAMFLLMWGLNWDNTEEYFAKSKKTTDWKDFWEKSSQVIGAGPLRKDVTKGLIHIYIENMVDRVRKMGEWTWSVSKT